MALFNFSSPNYARLATFIPDWNSVNEKLASGQMDEEEYQMWLKNTLMIFNAEIDEYV